MKAGGKNSRLGAFIRIYVPVTLLSLFCWIAAVGLDGPLSGPDSLVTDMMMRWRARMAGERGVDQYPATLLAIDAQTQNKFGRFGAGSWLPRTPYVNQIQYFRRNLKPSVICYDLLFIDPVGITGSGSGRVTEAPERLSRITGEMLKLADNPSMLMQGKYLEDLNRFSGEQGNDWLAHTLAIFTSSANRRPVLGCYFRGGWAAPQKGTVELWSPPDVYGTSEAGNEEEGLRIPYLKDIAIPAQDIHYLRGAGEESYDFARNAIFPSRLLLDYSYLGSLHGVPDADGVVRRLPMVIGFKYHNPVEGREKKVFVPTFSLLVSMLHLGMNPPFQPGQVEVYLGSHIMLRPQGQDPIRIPVDDVGQLYLNYEADVTQIPRLNFADVAVPEGMERRGELAMHRAKLDGRIAVIGVTTAGIDDGATPLSPRSPLVLVHLTAMHNILSDRCVGLLAGPMRTAWLMLILVLFTGLCLLERSARLGLFSIVFFLLYCVAASSSLYKNYSVLPVVVPAVYITMASFSVMTYRFFAEERSRRKIRNMFSTMVSDKVLTYLETNPDSFSLIGHQAYVTVMFSDIEGFTSISERLPPHRLTEILNRYFTPVTDSILRHGGYLDKYLGDGIMAVWGAPYADSAHALRACECALEQQGLLNDLNSRLQADYQLSFRIRMGINSGLVTAGNMGSEQKFQYTVMGDAVNFAARLEPVNKDFGTMIIIGPDTQAKVCDKLVTRRLGRIVVTGKQDALDIFELVGWNGSVPEDILQKIRIYEEALTAFAAGNWVLCLERLDAVDRLGGDGAAQCLRAQLNILRDKPLPADWKGEYIRTTKY
jgi:adenylate cyclase